MEEKYLGQSIAKLGFGFMRLPSNGPAPTDIDMDQVCKMVDLFLERGFTYFDTAYVYHAGDSEVALRKALVERHPRDSFTVATKMPFFDLKDESDVDKFFTTSMERMGVDFFDFYLLHNLGEDRIQKAEEVHAWEYLVQKKAEGKIRHIGFSTHAKPEEIDEMLTKHPEAEFIQLQLNYIDWESEKILARQCYEVARRHNKPIVVMEPIKGGFLASLTPEIREIFAEAGEGNTPADMALRYCASLDGIITVLSGMSTLEQVEENTARMSNWQPLSDKEKAAIDKAVEIINSVPTIPCTRCNYCTEVCPQEIGIPTILNLKNEYEAYGHSDVVKGNYDFRLRMSPKKGKASDCIQCGACENQCPQHIGIIAALEECKAAFEG